jgi:putative membrane protein
VMGPYGYGGGWMTFGWFTMLLFWALVIVGIVAVIRWASARGVSASRAPSDTPLEILKRRYASGEITKEQYEAMKRDIA